MSVALWREVAQVFPPFEDVLMATTVGGVGLHDEIFFPVVPLDARIVKQACCPQAKT